MLLINLNTLTQLRSHTPNALVRHIHRLLLSAEEKVAGAQALYVVDHGVGHCTLALHVLLVVWVRQIELVLVRVVLVVQETGTRAAVQACNA